MFARRFAALFTSSVLVVVGLLTFTVSPATAAVGDITTFTDPGGNVDSPFGITAGPDGNLWFTSVVNAVTDNS